MSIVARLTALLSPPEREEADGGMSPEEFQTLRDSAIERDESTCQLCGDLGYPKTSLGLTAVPVEPGEYAFPNLLTVCNQCVDRDVQQLRHQLREARSRTSRCSGQSLSSGA